MVIYGLISHANRLTHFLTLHHKTHQAPPVSSFLEYFKHFTFFRQLLHCTEQQKFCINYLHALLSSLLLPSVRLDIIVVKWHTQLWRFLSAWKMWWKIHESKCPRCSSFCCVSWEALGSITKVSIINVLLPLDGFSPPSLHLQHWLNELLKTFQILLKQKAQEYKGVRVVVTLISRKNCCEARKSIEKNTNTFITENHSCKFYQESSSSKSQECTSADFIQRSSLLLAIKRWKIILCKCCATEREGENCANFKLLLDKYQIHFLLIFFSFFLRFIVKLLTWDLNITLF